jgi:tRNA threonylcarbamoyladenosine biosynthesis protein TsaE
MIVKKEDLNNHAKEVLERITAMQKDTATVIGLSGDLGAGKTAWVKELGKCLDITQTIVSPTYTIENRYDILENNKFTQLVHMDAYRLQEKDLKTIFFDEVLESQLNLVCIEWPICLGNTQELVDIMISFEYIDQETREINIQTK